MEVASTKGLFQQINGLKSPPRYSIKCFTEAMEYKPTPDDVILSTYPKCGSTWMQCILIHIFSKGVPIENPLEFHFASPFIDMFGVDGVHKMTRPGVIKTHVPFSISRYSTEAKYIYLVRNPFDSCVSLYHHVKNRPGNEYQEVTFDDFFELFMTGEVLYGDYFDHLVSWYPHRKNKNVYFTTYENMKKDTKSTVLQLARFLGKEYEEEIDRNPSVINNILHYCSFDYMKSHFSDLLSVSKMASNVLENPRAPEGLKYFMEANSAIGLNRRELCLVRKGNVGEWRSYFSPNQEERLRQKLYAKDKDYKTLWPDI